MKKKSRFNEKFQEYISTWARLKEPNLTDMLTRLVKLWNRIEDLEAVIDSLPMAGKEWINYNKLLLKMIGQWNLLLVRMGLCYTAIPYITKEERVKSPREMIEINGKLKEFGKQVEKQVKKRINKGGARQWKDGTPINAVVKKKEKKKKNAI